MQSIKEIVIFRKFGIAYVMQSIFVFLYVIIFSAFVFGPNIFAWDTILFEITQTLIYACPPLMVGPVFIVVILAFSLRSKFPQQSYTRLFLDEYTNRLILGLILIIGAESLFISAISILNDLVTYILIGIAMVLYIFYDLVLAANWDFFSAFTQKFEISRTLLRFLRTLHTGILIDISRYILFVLFIFFGWIVTGVLYSLVSFLFYTIWFGAPLVIFISQMYIGQAIIRLSRYI